MTKAGPYLVLITLTVSTFPSVGVEAWRLGRKDNRER